VKNHVLLTLISDLLRNRFQTGREWLMAYFKEAEKPDPVFVPAYDVKIVGGKKIIIWRDKNNNNSSGTASSGNSSGTGSNNAKSNAVHR
jgi:hypothetical protein